MHTELFIFYEPGGFEPSSCYSFVGFFSGFLYGITLLHSERCAAKYAPDFLNPLFDPSHPLWLLLPFIFLCGLLGALRFAAITATALFRRTGCARWLAKLIQMAKTAKHELFGKASALV